MKKLMPIIDTSRSRSAFVVKPSSITSQVSGSIPCTDVLQVASDWKGRGHAVTGAEGSCRGKPI